MKGFTSLFQYLLCGCCYIIIYCGLGCLAARLLIGTGEVRSSHIRVVVLLVALFGLVSLGYVPIQLTPDVDRPRATVRTTCGAWNVPQTVSLPFTLSIEATQPQVSSGQGWVRW